MIGYGAINTAPHTGPQPGTFDPVLTSLSGILVAQLAIGVLGVLVITSEYSTGMIRSTFAAAPQRHLVIAAKAAAFGAIAFAVGTVASADRLPGRPGHPGRPRRQPHLTRRGCARSSALGLYLGLLGRLRRRPGHHRPPHRRRHRRPGRADPDPARTAADAARLASRTRSVKFLPGNAGQAIFTTTKTPLPSPLGPAWPSSPSTPPPPLAISPRPAPPPRRLTSAHQQELQHAKPANSDRRGRAAPSTPTGPAHRFELVPGRASATAAAGFAPARHQRPRHSPLGRHGEPPCLEPGLNRGPGDRTRPSRWPTKSACRM